MSAPKFDRNLLVLVLAGRYGKNNVDAKLRACRFSSASFSFILLTPRAMSKLSTIMDKSLLLGDQIYTLSNFLQPDECKELIEQSLSHGYKPSPPSGGGHGRTGVIYFAFLFRYVIVFVVVNLIIELLLSIVVSLFILTSFFDFAARGCT